MRTGQLLRLAQVAIGIAIGLWLVIHSGANDWRTMLLLGAWILAYYFGYRWSRRELQERCSAGHALLGHGPSLAMRMGLTGATRADSSPPAGGGG